MASTPLVGLDIGSFAVRAAELVPGGSRPTLSRFAQVTLPPGAVVDGEVMDVDTVAGAIKRLWAEGGFKTKQVIVGVASQRVIVRQAEVAAMAEEDLRSALRFEVQDLIPIPMDDAELDFCVLDPTVTNGDEPTMRILLAASQRDVVSHHLAAVSAAGLSASSVDVVPLALLRALPEAAPSTSEAIIAVGGGLTNVVVRERGIPRFVRVLSVGGDDVTAAIAEELSCDLEYAEHLKRTAAPGRASLAGGNTATIVRASTLVAERVMPLVEEIRGSLDFYLAQSNVDHIDRVIVTGGGLLTPGLIERLRDSLGHQVEAGDPLEGLAVGKTGLSPEDLRKASPLMAASVGLALAGIPVKPGQVREDGTEIRPLRVNLLPAGVVAARRQRRQSVAAGLAVVAFAASLGGAWAVRGHQVSNAEHQATVAEVQVSNLQGQLNKLSDVTKLQNDLKARQQAVLAALSNDIDFVRLVQQITASMPPDVWLTSFTAQRTATGEPGTVTFGASGLSEDAVVRWVQQVGTMPSLSGLWVSATAKGNDPTIQTVTFQSTATITPSARSNRAAQLAGVKP